MQNLREQSQLQSRQHYNGYGHKEERCQPSFRERPLRVPKLQQIRTTPEKTLLRGHKLPTQKAPETVLISRQSPNHNASDSDSCSKTKGWLTAAGAVVLSHDVSTSLAATNTRKGNNNIDQTMRANNVSGTAGDTETAATILCSHSINYRSEIAQLEINTHYKLRPMLAVRQRPTRYEQGLDASTLHT